MSSKPGENAWTIWGHSRKLSCPKCRDEGRAEDDKVNLLLLQFGDLLRHRLVAEPNALYGNEHEHGGDLMLHCDAERADEVPGDGCSNRAFRIVVSIVVVDEPHPTGPIDFWDLPDMTAEEACVVQEQPATYGAYLFPKTDEVSLCLLDRPYGTVVEVRVNWLGLEHDRIRTIHLSLCGGRASSETGYRSVFRHQSMLNLLSEAEVVELAKAECEYRFKELNPGTDPDQQRLF